MRGFYRRRQTLLIPTGPSRPRDAGPTALQLRRAVPAGQRHPFPSRSPASHLLHCLPSLSAASRVEAALGRTAAMPPLPACPTAAHYDVTTTVLPAATTTRLLPAETRPPPMVTWAPPKCCSV